MSGFEILGAIAFAAALPGIIDSCIDRIKNSPGGSGSLSVLDAAKTIVSEQHQNLDRKTASLVVMGRKGTLPLSDAVIDGLEKVLEKLNNKLKDVDTSLASCIDKTNTGSSLGWYKKRDLATKLGKVLKQGNLLRQLLESIALYQNITPKPQDQLILMPTELEILEDQAETLPYSTMRLAEGNTGARKPNEFFILESMNRNYSNQKVAEHAICNLAQPLLKRSPGILKLCGYRHSESGDYQLVFEVPSGCRPRSLHDLLLNQHEPKPSLTSRWDICYQLAAVVLETHNRRLVHKSICPQNLLLHPPTKDPLHLGTLFLTHWVGSRIIENATNYAGPGTWQRSIYQHPDRQLKQNTISYGIGHDMYSLGACMLEILLWQPFVKEIDDGGLRLNEWYGERVIKLELRKGRYKRDPVKLMETPKDVQRFLVHIAEQELPAAAGDKVSDLVINCLTCLEDGFDGQYNVKKPGEKEPPEMHASTGLNYVLEILKVLSS